MKNPFTLFFTLYIISFLTGCSPKQVTHYWENGNLKENGEELRSKKIGIYEYYNQIGQKVGIAEYDNGKLVKYQTIHPQSYFYDSLGRLTEIRIYGPKGYFMAAAPNTPYRSTTAIIRYQYDVQGRMLKEERFNLNNELIKGYTYAPATVYEYDSAGNLLSKAFYNSDNEPWENVLKMSRETHTYSDKGLMIKSEYWDAAGARTDAYWGVSVIHYQYDNKDRLSKKILLSPDGSLAPVYDLGPPIQKYVYDSLDRLTRHEYWLNDSVPDVLIKYQYSGEKLLSSTWYDMPDTVNFRTKTYHMYDKNGNSLSSHTIDSSGDTIRSEFSECYIKVREGWKWQNFPEELPCDNINGQLTFKVTLDDNGHPTEYSITSRAASDDMIYWCWDALNRATFEAEGDPEDNKLTVDFKFGSMDYAAVIR